MTFAQMRAFALSFLPDRSDFKAKEAERRRLYAIAAAEKKKAADAANRARAAAYALDNFHRMNYWGPANFTADQAYNAAHPGEYPRKTPLTCPTWPQWNSLSAEQKADTVNPVRKFTV